MFRILLLLSLIILPQTSLSQERLIIAGDGGEINPAVLELLVEQASQLPKKTTVVMLGDNVYPDGLLENRPELEQAFREQLVALSKTGAKVIYIPGNHDWGKVDTNKRVLRQELAVKEVLGSDSFLPSNSCPGPVSYTSPDEEFYIVMIDSEALLRDRHYTDSCKNKSLDDVVIDLKIKLSLKPKGAKLIYLQHHPLKSFGHNAYLTDMCPQRMTCPKNKKLVQAVLETLKSNPPDYCASGHEHTLQIIKGDESCKTYLTSGSLSYTYAPKDSPELVFSSDKFGFFVLSDKLYSITAK